MTTREQIMTFIEGRHGATTIIEAGPAGALTRGTLHRDAGIIERVVLIGAYSTNGSSGKRVYSPKALAQIAEHGENLPCFLNHTSPDKAFAARPVQDLVGKFVNVRHDPVAQKVVGDLQVLDHQVPLVFALAERMGHQVGASVVSKGLVRMESDGTETVDSIQALRSADLVSDPASTRGLFESILQEARQQESVSAIYGRIFGAPVPMATYARLIEAFCPGVQPPTSREPAPEDETATALHRRLAAAVRR